MRPLIILEYIRTKQYLSKKDIGCMELALISCFRPPYNIGGEYSNFVKDSRAKILILRIIFSNFHFRVPYNNFHFKISFQKEPKQFSFFIFSLKYFHFKNFSLRRKLFIYKPPFYML